MSGAGLLGPETGASLAACQRISAALADAAYGATPAIKRLKCPANFRMAKRMRCTGEILGGQVRRLTVGHCSVNRKRSVCEGGRNYGWPSTGRARRVAPRYFGPTGD